MVLLKTDEQGKNCLIGQPYTGEQLSAKIVEHVKGEKVRVFKMKPKTRFAKTKGHRQNYTILEIGDF
jgi:large subunit ribosomal protein L21